MATATQTRPETTRLTEAFRAAEAQRAAMVAAAVALYWRQRVDATDPSSVERWLAAMVPLILRERESSANRAVLFGNAARVLEVGDRSYTFQRPDVDSNALEVAIRTSLSVTGPVAFQKRLERISGAEVTPAEEKALFRLGDEPAPARQAYIRSVQRDVAAGPAGAAARHVQNGGRDVLVDNTKHDPTALGYVRITKAEPCYFCAMLASRGMVFKGDSFKDSDSFFDGPGHYKVHDSCACTLVPIYRPDDDRLDRSEEFERLWVSSTRGKSGRDAVNAFRRAYEGR